MIFTTTLSWQYFLNPKVAREPVPPQLELIAEKILVPLLPLFHHFVEKVLSSFYLMFFWYLSYESFPVDLPSFYSRNVLTGFWCQSQAIRSQYETVVEIEKILLIISKCMYFAVSFSYMSLTMFTANFYLILDLERKGKIKIGQTNCLANKH